MSQFDGFLESLNEVPSQLDDQAGAWEVGGVFIGPAPADFGSALALDPEYLKMCRDARLLGDMKEPPRQEALCVYETLCKHWLDNINVRLSSSRYNALALAEAVFGFDADEDPQMKRLDAAYQFHCGVIGLVYEVCSRASLLCNPEAINPPPCKRRRVEPVIQIEEESNEPPEWKKRKLDVVLRLRKVIEVFFIKIQ